jgi:hypothetical protein
MSPEALAGIFFVILFCAAVHLARGIWRAHQPPAFKRNVEWLRRSARRRP